MKRATRLLMVIAILLSMTTLSLTLQASESPGITLTEVPATVGIMDAVNLEDGIAVAKDAIDGNGFNWLKAFAWLIPSIFMGGGWLLSRWDGKNKSILLATFFEGSEAVTAGLTYLATRKKVDLDRAVKEAKDVIAVPRSMLQEQKLQSGAVPRQARH